MVQGNNDSNQIVLPKNIHLREEISNNCPFFPEFIKVDQLSPFEIQTASVGQSCILAVGSDRASKDQKVFGWGLNSGQISDSEAACISEPRDVTSYFLKVSEEDERVEDV